ncbi:hypothetical protein BDE02_15G064000 [Populus trichocarpa]|nr:hypothetical protein BDE02_15G064000 [Populus trichocarpa]
MQESNIYSICLLLFQIDYRKDVCLVAVAPPIEKLQRLSTQSFFGSFLSISAVQRCNHLGDLYLLRSLL